MMTTSVIRSLTFVSDPGHGWLDVPLKDLERLGITDKISHFSYVKGDRVYLEEDLDAQRYLYHATQAGWKVKIQERSINRSSAIRNYARYENGEK